MGRRPPVFDLPSPHLSRVASALREVMRGAWPFGRKVERQAAVERQPGKRIHFEALEQRLLLSGGVLPASSTLLQESEPENNLQVGRYGNNSPPGAYELHVERTRGIQHESDARYSDYTVGSASPRSLAGGQSHRTATVSGTIMAAEGSNTDEDVYSLGLVNAGNVIELSTRMPGDGTLSPKVVLLDAAGQLLPDSDGDTTDDHARVTLTADGVIYAQVESNSGSGSGGQYLREINISDPVPPRVTGLPAPPQLGRDDFANFGFRLFAPDCVHSHSCSVGAARPTLIAW